MDYISVGERKISATALCQAHAQLESDYNVGGILRERPSNGRRNASTGWQLHRMGYRPGPLAWVDITAEAGGSDDDSDSEAEDVRYVYLSNVLKWALPLDEATALACKRVFEQAQLAPYIHLVDAALNRQRVHIA